MSRAGDSRKGSLPDARRESRQETDAADACAEVGLEPLPEDELAVLARAMLAGVVTAEATLH